MKKKSAARSFQLIHAVQVLVTVLLVITLNVIVVELSERYPLSVDLTTNSRYALSDTMQDFLSGLEKPVRIYVLANEEAFSQASMYTTYAATILQQCKRFEQVEVRYVDYTRDPTFAARYPELKLMENSMVIECEDRAVSIMISDLFQYSYSASNEIQITAFGEARLTSAIVDVLYDDHARALVLVGNGAQPAEGLQRLLDANGFEVGQTNLALAGLDSQADLLLLIAPTVDLTQNQLSALESWLNNGGRYGKTLFYAADVTQPELPRLEGLLKDWGVAVDDGAVFETSADRTSQNQPFFATLEIIHAQYAEAFANADTSIIAPMARPLTVRFARQEGYVTQNILQFSDTSGVRPSNAAADFSAADAARRGPIPALVECRIQAGEQTSRIYVCASASLVDSTILEGNAFLNRQFLLKLFSDLGGGADLVSFAGKKLTDSFVHIPTVTANSLGIVLAIALPLSFIGLGILIFIKRRRL
jgi:ABC-2 type transport system permease protein